jgi:hypothetical protein
MLGLFWVAEQQLAYRSRAKTIAVSRGYLGQSTEAANSQKHERTFTKALKITNERQIRQKTINS